MAKVLRTTRLAYVQNYFLILLLILTYLVVRGEGLLVHLLHLSIAIFVIALVLEPEVKRRNRYIITPNEVMAIEKGWMYEEKTVLPYKSITDVKIRQGFWGKLFGFGDLELSTPKYSIKMFGVKRVEELCEEVKKKISKMA